MSRGSRRILHAIALLSATAGLAACQSTDVKPQIQAAAPAPVMDSDIQKILVAGGLNANAPGSLQTAKMPAEVQQAVAALQGNPVPAAGAVPAAGVTQIAAVEPSSPLPLVTPVAGKPAAPPMLAALQATGGRGRRGRHAAPAQYALAPVPAAAQAPVAAPPQMAPQQVASNGNENLSQVRSYLPTLPPQSQTIVLTGPNAHPRYSGGGNAGGGNTGGGIAVPSARATQAAVKVMQAPAPVAAAAPEPESPRIRRF